MLQIKIHYAITIHLYILILDPLECQELSVFIYNISILHNWLYSSSHTDLLKQYYELVEYAKRTLSLAGVSHVVIWRKIVTTPRSKGSSDILLMTRILFTVPISKAKLEKMFSKLKHVKTNFCCSVGVTGLENILWIMEEGSSWETFDPISAIKLWSNTK